jgi:hypothetical protein
VIRVRLFRGRSLVGNSAAAVRNNRAQFMLGRRLRKGSYRARVTVDADGHVKALTQAFRIR